ncbi:unnamed protein product [Hapterophycus canaliculatus]
MYCSRHAEDGMVDVLHKRCAHLGGCKKRPNYGCWTDGKGTFCAEHKGDITGEGLVINFGQRCREGTAKKCGGMVKWGPQGVQPTHCDKHGKLKANDGFVRVPTNRRTSGSPSSSGATSRRGHIDSGCDGAPRRARKARPPTVQGSDEEEDGEEDAEEEQEDEEEEDEEEDGEEDCESGSGFEANSESESEPEPEKPKRKIIWL